MHRARVSRLCIHTLRTKYQLIILSENYNTPILSGVTTILANLSNSQYTTILFLVYESRPHRSYTIICFSLSGTDMLSTVATVYHMLCPHARIAPLCGGWASWRPYTGHICVELLRRRCSTPSLYDMPLVIVITQQRSNSKLRH